MSAKDEQLEVRIQVAKHTMLYAVNPFQRQEAAERLSKLVAKRSPEKVDAMEMEKGIHG